MACDIQKLAEYILANREIAKDALWNRVNEVMGQPSKSYIAPEVKSNSKLPVELINPEHHEFNKLPFYKEGQKTMTYAGIGSRKTPDEVLEAMTEAAQWLESKGYKLQTGYKRKTGDRIKEEGADKAFSIGTKNKELFGPDMANDKTIAIAHEVYPNLKGMWEHTYNKWVETVGETKAKEYADGAINLQARNTFQVFGASLDTPVDFVLFYAEETSNPLRPKGGTGQAVEMARRKGIPTINMVNKDWRKQLEEVLQFKKSDNDTKVGLDDNNTTTLEEELTYLNSKKTIKGTLPQKGQKVDFQLADGDTATGVIHQMLDGTMLGYANGQITELASGKYVITYKGGSVKDKFTEAITKLKTVSGDNKTAVEQAIKDGTFNKDIPKSRVLKMAIDVRKKRIKKVAKDMWWKRYAAETKYVPGKYNDYYGAMEKTITKIVDPKVVTNVVGLMLEDVFNGKFQIVAGDYDPDTHTVQIAEKPRQMEIEMAVEDGLQEEATKLYETTTENMAHRAELIEDYVNKNRANALAYVISSVESVNGGHTTTHELIHAGSVNFMRDPKNANHPAVIRVKELYKEALARESDIRIMTRTGDVYTEYWKKSEEEFISEALSNPQLMYALSNIKIVGKEKLSKGLFAELVESLIKMLGLNKKTEDNLLEFTMDGFAAIMEAQAVELSVPVNKELKEADESEVAQDKRDTMTIKEILAKVDKMREECE